jgi:hypothetical protein
VKIKLTSVTTPGTTPRSTWPAMTSCMRSSRALDILLCSSSVPSDLSHPALTAVLVFSVASRRVRGNEFRRGLGPTYRSDRLHK